MSEPPLQGLQVLDLSCVLAGPYCTMLLVYFLAVNRSKAGRDSRGVETLDPTRRPKRRRAPRGA